MAGPAKDNNSVASDPFQTMTRRNGVSFFCNQECPLNNYLKSFAQSLPDAHIVSASRISNGRIAVYLSSRAEVENAILHGFQHDNEYVEITPLVRPATRIVFSNVYPEIPNTVLANNVSDFCKLVSPIRPIPLGIKEANLSHVLSFRRQAYVLIEPNIVLPDHINLSNNGVNYRVFLSTESAKCFNCGEIGHLSKACKKDSAQDDNPLNPKPTFIHSKSKSDPKHPAKKSKPSNTPPRSPPSPLPCTSRPPNETTLKRKAPPLAHATPPRTTSSDPNVQAPGSPKQQASPVSSVTSPQSSVHNTTPPRVNDPSTPKPFWSPPVPSRQPSPLFSTVVSKEKSTAPQTKDTPRQRPSPLKTAPTPLPTPQLPPSPLKTAPTPLPTVPPVVPPSSPSPSISMEEVETSDRESVSSDVSQCSQDFDEFATIPIPRGPLRQNEMVKFLKCVKSSKKALKIARKFTPDVPGLVRQLKPLRNNPLLNHNQQQRVRLLIKRLDPDEPLFTRKK